MAFAPHRSSIEILSQAEHVDQISQPMSEEWGWVGSGWVLGGMGGLGWGQLWYCWMLTKQGIKTESELPTTAEMWTEKGRTQFEGHQDRRPITATRCCHLFATVQPSTGHPRDIITVPGGVSFSNRPYRLTYTPAKYSIACRSARPFLQLQWNWLKNHTLQTKHR